MKFICIGGGGLIFLHGRAKALQIEFGIGIMKLESCEDRLAMAIVFA